MRALGKVDRRYFHGHIAGMLGSRRADVLLPPDYGFDFGLIDIGRGGAIAVSTDPIWIEKSFGLRQAAWFAFHSIVGDVALSGLSPSHLALDWNLPAGIQEGEFRDMLKVFSHECRRLGMSVVAGHTGVYEGSSFPSVGGGTALAVGRMKDVIRTDGARVGDSVVITKSPATETAVTLCKKYADYVVDFIEKGARARLLKMFDRMSVVDEAMIAASVTGVTSMHDASERGVAAALNEMSYASGVVIDFDKSRVEVNSDVNRLCSSLKMDPFCCSSQGSLLLTARPALSEDVVQALSGHGIEAFIAGKVVGRGEGVFEVSGNRRRSLVAPRDDHLLRGISTLEERRQTSKTRDD